MRCLCTGRGVSLFSAAGKFNERSEDYSFTLPPLVRLPPEHPYSLTQVLGPDRRVCVARELTKVHEEFFR